MTGQRDVRVRRAYEKPSYDDGRRILVDRLWPRGLSKAAAGIDEWMKSVAPSPELRLWYGHDPGKFDEFKRRYLDELREPEQAAAFARLCEEASEGTITLITASKAAEISDAAVLANQLRSGGACPPGDRAVADEDDPPGDPPCLQRRVCERCGGVADSDPPTTCPHCGADMPGDLRPGQSDRVCIPTWHGLVSYFNPSLSAPAGGGGAGIITAMTSWRDSASQQAQADLDGLLNITLPFAQQMLAKRGEFYPFGATVTAGGETRLLAADLGQDHPGSADLLSVLVERLRQDRTGLRAVAICSDVRLSDSGAIRVELEHQDGHAMAVLMPYKKKRFARGIEFDDLRADAADKQVWVQLSCALAEQGPSLDAREGARELRRLGDLNPGWA